MSQEEIVREIGNYKLVARQNPNGGGYAGVLWRDGKKVFSAVAASLSEAFSKIEVHRSQLIYDEMAMSATEPTTANQARDAFVKLSSSIHPNQLKMLRAHLNAPEQRITARELAAAAGYSNYSGANMQYGLLAAAFWEFCPTMLPRRKDGSIIWTCALAESGVSDFQEKDDEWVWKLRPHVAEGLALSGVL